MSALDRIEGYLPKTQCDASGNGCPSLQIHDCVGCLCNRPHPLQVDLANVRAVVEAASAPRYVCDPVTRAVRTEEGCAVCSARELCEALGRLEA